MNYFIIKVKDKELFYNEDTIMEQFISKIPILLTKKESDILMRCFNGFIYTPDEKQKFSKEDLEVKEIKITFI